MQMQINIQTKVNSKSIRRELRGGRAHVVLPSWTLPANVVMNGGLYPASEIDAHYLKLEGTFAPLGHPVMDGKYISATSPDAVNAFHIGAQNLNVKKIGGRVYVEKWVDVEVAKSYEGGRELLARVEALERGEDVAPIHTSVAVFAEQEPAPEGVTDYQWIARIHGVDHDAILLNEVGAATPEQGVGLFVNADSAKPALVANSGVLDGESYEDKRQRLQDAASAFWVTDPDRDYVWIADFTDSQAIVSRNGGNAEVFGYKMEAGRVVFENTGVPVKRKESWVIKANALVRNILGIKAPQINVAKEETEMAFSDEDKAFMSNMVANAVADGLKPIQEKVDTLQANQEVIRTTITANAEVALADKRAKVKAKFGDVVANSATPEALDALIAQCGEAANLLPNNSGGAQNTGLKADVANLPKE